jgi:hypothetical protein
MDLMDADNNWLADISPNLVSWDVEYDCTSTVQGTGTFVVAQELQGGWQRVRPYQLLSGAGLKNVRWDLGVYLLTTPELELSQKPGTYTIDGSSLIYLLQNQIGDTYTVTAGTSYLRAVSAVIQAAGVTGAQILIDQTKAGLQVPNDLVWALTGDTGSAYGGSGGGSTTAYLDVANQLLAAIAYIPLWADWEGNYRSSPYIPPSDLASEFTFDLTQLKGVMVSDPRQWTNELWQAFNWWRYLNSNVTGAVEGAGQYTYINESSGPSSVSAVKREVRNVVTVASPDQPTLAGVATQAIAQALQATSSLAVKVSPFPAAGNFDMFTYKDAAMPDGQNDVLVQSQGWSISSDGSDGSQTWEVVGPIGAPAVAPVPGPVVGPVLASLSITTGSLPGGTVSDGYSTTIAATGGLTPYVWTVSSGSLPAGLTLSPSGALSGTPTASGTSSFTILVTDSTSPSAETASVGFSIVVAAAPVSLSITTGSLPGVTVSDAYSATFAATGGTTPYAWAVASGSLPTGLSLSSAGVISGTPSTTGTSTFTVRVTDSSTPTAKTATASFSIVVSAASATTLLGIFVSDMQASDEEAAATALGVTATVITQYGNNSSPYNYSAPSGLGTKRLVVGLGAMSSAVATTVAENLVSTGNANAIIRLMWEMNGNWYAWGTSGGSLGWTGAQYVTQWITIREAMMAVSGAEFQFLWNMNGTSAGSIPTASYPGSAYVDIIGTDQYSYGGYASNLAGAVAYAQAQGKPFAIGEWGCATGGGQTGDDPAYINTVAGIIKNPANNCVLQMYFSDPSISGFPNAEAAYKAAFG